MFSIESIFEKRSLFFICGPCVIESEDLVKRCAEVIKKFSEKYKINTIFKSSYDKANRTLLNSFRGPGIEKGLRILSKVREEFDLPVLSDIHCRDEISMAAEVLDIIQIPAFLSRQTDLVVDVARTGKPINIKKGQFMSPYDMKYVVEKCSSVNNKKIIITERGTFFGYGDLVSDMRSIIIMRKFGYPIVFDGTHSAQRPSINGGVSGGNREFVPYLSRAAAAVGVDGFFFEIHSEPDKALSDSATSIDFETLENVIKNILKIKSVVSDF